MSLEITKVTFYDVKNNSFIKANGEVEFNNQLIIKVAIGEGKEGLMVIYKSDVVEKDGQKKYYPHIRFTSEEARDVINTAIIDHYRASTKNNTPASAAKAKTKAAEEIHSAIPKQSTVDEDIPF